MSATLPVTGCTGTIQGISPFPKPPPSARFRVAANARHALTAYGGQTAPYPGFFTLAPKGWKCKGLGGSGGLVIDVSNPHGGFHSTTVLGYKPNEIVTLQGD